MEILIVAITIIVFPVVAGYVRGFNQLDPNTKKKVLHIIGVQTKMKLVIFLLIAYAPFFYWMITQAIEDNKSLNKINMKGK